MLPAGRVAVLRPGPGADDLARASHPSLASTL